MEREAKGNGRIESYTLANGKTKYRARITLQGKRYQREGFTTKTSARAWLAQIKSSASDGTLADNNSPLFPVYVEKFIAHKQATKRRQKTLESYQSIINTHLLPYFGKKKMKNITTSDLNNFFDRVIAPLNLKIQTRRNIRNVLNGIFTLAVKENKMGYNPLTKIDTMHEVQENTRKALTIEEVHKLLEVADRYYLTKKDYKSVNMYIYPYIYLSVYTGARRGELCALTWDDIDIENNIVSINKTLTEHRTLEKPKTQRGIRFVNIPPDVMQKIAQFKDDKCNIVFHTKNGTYENPSNIARGFRNVLAFGELPHIRLHELRHTYATIAIQANVPITDISRVLGHAKTSTTLDFYSHPSKESAQKVADGFSKLLKGSDTIEEKKE